MKEGKLRGECQKKIERGTGEGKRRGEKKEGKLGRKTNKGT